MPVGLYEQLFNHIILFVIDRTFLRIRTRQETCQTPIRHTH